MVYREMGIRTIQYLVPEDTVNKKIGKWKCRDMPKCLSGPIIFNMFHKNWLYGKFLISFFHYKKPNSREDKSLDTEALELNSFL